MMTGRTRVAKQHSTGMPEERRPRPSRTPRRRGRNARNDDGAPWSSTRPRRSRPAPRLDGAEKAALFRSLVQRGHLEPDRGARLAPRRSSPSSPRYGLRPAAVRVAPGQEQWAAAARRQRASDAREGQPAAAAPGAVCAARPPQRPSQQQAVAAAFKRHVAPSAAERGRRRGAAGGGVSSGGVFYEPSAVA